MMLTKGIAPLIEALEKLPKQQKLQQKEKPWLTIIAKINKECSITNILKKGYS